MKSSEILKRKPNVKIRGLHRESYGKAFNNMTDICYVFDVRVQNKEYSIKCLEKHIALKHKVPILTLTIEKEIISACENFMINTDWKIKEIDLVCIEEIIESMDVVDF